MKARSNYTDYVYSLEISLFATLQIIAVLFKIQECNSKVITVTKFKGNKWLT